MTWATVTVCGYVAAKPTIRHFERGTVLCSFPLYVNRRKGDGEEVPPLKFQVEIWGNQAETAMNLLDKGTRTTVTGRLDEDHYTDKEGQPATALKIRFAEVLDYGVKPAEEPAPASP
jgi:single-strand DNA-binding protein